MKSSDEELMKQICSGDAGAFDEFRRRHEATLRLHLRRYVGDADHGDLLQDVFVRVWSRSGQWDGSGSPLAWTLRIGTNLALNRIRDLRAHAEVPLDDGACGDADEVAAAFEAASASPAEQVEWREAASRALDLLQQMPPDTRAIVRMARLQQMKLRDIAEAVDVPLGTVKSRLHAATRWLSAQWEDDR